jgi:hypothetical protein
LQNQDVDPADNAGGLPIERDQVIEYLKSCIKERILE